ncbi:Eco57I restriction-modification methylase domain-containing protein [Methanoculleus sp.]|uniref:Eco57I restriction-modification methylase domain-containing protein n=1 Tax=Methanoculleus sp. TaxID=90427 RepID=UPI002FC8D12D
MPAPPEIVDLVKRFDQYYTKYTSPSYNEFQVRKEFIDPFFEALGWDVNNRSGLDERYKDVIHEDTVRVEASTKAPDYSFRIGGMRKFFVEAKKPAVNLKENPEPAYQVRRYAWSAKLPVSLLTDFEEFIVYDCTAKPSPADKASAKRIGYYRYTDYIEKWDEIAAIFSKHGILTGGYDDYVESLKLKKGGKGTAGIDDAFLAEIEGWREILAKNIALRNRDLSIRELNAAVQKTIDRIIFLRICEDRGIEEYGQLKRIAAGKDIYEQLKGVFRYADDRYNSGLFHFSTETGREDPDNLTLSLSIDDKVLKQIIGHLYYPDSPYEFSVFPADVLGQVYEQFLGKVIRLTAGHQAKVEEKPEVKKAGGVFYTPTYIVEYIVEQTVGNLVGGKDPKAVAGLHVLDPACGSGSFLLGAYQYLLDWHLAWYMDNLVPLLAGGKKMTDPAVLELLPVKPAPAKSGRGRKKRGDEYILPVYQVTETDWRLTTEEKKRILLNNIYGVDIDPQAVEVTKLSLLLKVLEGEKSERIGKQLTIAGERVLPSLHENIKCGNSLVGPDIYNDVQVTLDDEETIFRINAFDWNRAFPAVMQAGGFDAVIGNPPYVRLQAMKEWAPVEVEVYKRLYKTARKGNYDIYVVFVEKGLDLLNDQGQLGFILPHKFFTAKYGEPLRELIATGEHLAEVTHFGYQQVFKGATTYTCLLFLSKAKNASFRYQKVDDLNEWKKEIRSPNDTLPKSAVTISDWNFVLGDDAALFEKLERFERKLGHIAHVFVGTQTSAEDVFVLTNCRVEGNFVKGMSKASQEEVSVERGCIKRFLKGRQIRRYVHPESNISVICPYEITEDNFRLLPKNELVEKYPSTFEYLSKHKKMLAEREKGRFKGDNWYAYGYPKSMTLFQRNKIVCPFYDNKAAYSYDTEGYFFKTGYGIIPNDSEFSDYYLLGLLNSQLLFWYYKKVCTFLNSGYAHYMTQYIEQIPIRTIDPANPADVARHDRMVALVEQMLDLNRRLAAAKAPHEKEVLAGMIDATDRQIDRLVYELYGLTEEEIAVVEGTKE